MKNGWTGGQYSLFRVILAAYLFVHFVTPFPFGALATVPLALGIFDRAAALAILCLWAGLLGRYSLIWNPSIPFVGLLLLAHSLLPPAPYGSLKARNRADPGGGWSMPEPMFLAAWIVMALAYVYGGATKLVSPSWVDGTAPLVMRLATWSALALQLCFAPLALSRKLRPWIWLGMVGVHLGVLVFVDFVELSSGMLLLHLLIFDPAWIRPRAARGTETLFYDGHCALCHGAVRFVLAEDRSGSAFRFAPLQGEGFVARIPAAERAALPDSLVVLSSELGVLTRSAAVLHLLARMGGLWRILGAIARVVPAPLRDAAYDGVARIRYRLFGRRADLCPIVPASMLSRFDLE